MGEHAGPIRRVAGYRVWAGAMGDDHQKVPEKQGREGRLKQNPTAHSTVGE